MSSTDATPPYVGTLAIQLRCVSKLLASVIERLEEVENLQAVTAYEQAEVVETLARLGECLRLMLAGHGIQGEHRI